MAVALAIVGGVTWRVLDVTAPGDDFFDSDLYPWTWIVLPLVGGLAGMLRPGPWRHWAWAGALMGPLMLATAILGNIGHDPDDGASLWLVGEMFLAVTGLLVAASAAVGASVRRPRG